GEPEVVVGVVVRQEHLAQVDEADRRAEELALRALGAVEEKPLPATLRDDRRRRALGRRHRAGSAEEDELEVHGGRILRPLPAVAACGPMNSSGVVTQPSATYATPVAPTRTETDRSLTAAP